MNIGKSIWKSLIPDSVSDGKDAQYNKETIRDRKEQPVTLGCFLVVRPLINDFLRKMAKFRHQENQDVSVGTRIRFFIDKPAAMISFPRAVIKYL